MNWRIWDICFGLFLIVGISLGLRWSKGNFVFAINQHTGISTNDGKYWLERHWFTGRIRSCAWNQAFTNSAGSYQGKSWPEEHFPEGSRCETWLNPDNATALMPIEEKL